MSKLIMRLYITGRTLRSDMAVENLHAILDVPEGRPYELTVIDVLHEPQLAENDRILATPTLVKTSPSPARRIIGDLSDRKQVTSCLDLQDLEHEAGENDHGQK